KPVGRPRTNGKQEGDFCCSGRWISHWVEGQFVVWKPTEYSPAARRHSRGARESDRSGSELAERFLVCSGRCVGRECGVYRPAVLAGTRYGPRSNGGAAVPCISERKCYRGAHLLRATTAQGRPATRKRYGQPSGWYLARCGSLGAAGRAM